MPTAQDDFDSVDEVEGALLGLPAMLSSAAVGDIGVGVDGIRQNEKKKSAGQGACDVEAHVIYPAKHHVVGEWEMSQVLAAITAEMEERCSQLAREGRVLETERLRQRTENDLLLLRSVGTCKVILY